LQKILHGSIGLHLHLSHERLWKLINVGLQPSAFNLVLVA